MDYAAFDSERRRIIRAWGTEMTDPEQLAEAVRQLREQAATIPGAANQDRATRYLGTLDELVAAVEEPESPSIRQASDVLLKASGPEGTPAERQARAAAGMAEIARIAAEVPTVGERDAVLEMNETLAPIAAGGPARESAARFIGDPALPPPGSSGASAGTTASRPAVTGNPKQSIRDL